MSYTKFRIPVYLGAMASTPPMDDIACIFLRGFLSGLPGTRTTISLSWPTGRSYLLADVWFDSNNATLMAIANRQLAGPVVVRAVTGYPGADPELITTAPSPKALLMCKHLARSALCQLGLLAGDIIIEADGRVAVVSFPLLTVLDTRQATGFDIGAENVWFHSMEFSNQFDSPTGRGDPFDISAYSRRPSSPSFYDEIIDQEDDRFLAHMRASLLPPLNTAAMEMQARLNESLIPPQPTRVYETTRNQPPAIGRSPGPAHEPEGE